MLDETIFGEKDKSGKIVRDVSICAATRMSVGSGDAYIPIPNTNHFYRLKAPLYRVSQVREDVIDDYRRQLGLEPIGR